MFDKIVGKSIERSRDDARWIDTSIISPNNDNNADNDDWIII